VSVHKGEDVLSVVQRQRGQNREQNWTKTAYCFCSILALARGEEKEEAKAQLSLHTAKTSGCCAMEHTGLVPSE